MNDVIIYGNGKTGKALGGLLQKQGISFAYYTDIDGFVPTESFTNKTVIISPGIHPMAKGIIQAKKNNAKLIGELEYCWRLCKGKIISVTGTNGKTTTCQMMQKALETNFDEVFLLGNGGIPFSSKVLEISPEQYVILESSSFMLNDANTFAPFISVFTNFAEDHLDFHGSFANYLSAKCNNFLHQNNSEWSIFNRDDKHLVELSKLCKSKVLFYSLEDDKANCFVKNRDICISLKDKKYHFRSDLMLKLSKHNLSNALAVILCCAVIGLDHVKVEKALKNYVFLPHRLQKIGEICNVVFIDDSKATNVHATQSAINSFNCPIALILGGSNKNAYFDPLFSGLSPNVKTVTACGQTSKTLQECGKKYGINVIILDDIQQCAWHCFEYLKKVGGVVLMSNACASFDVFANYEQRGNYFFEVVKKIECSISK